MMNFSVQVFCNGNEPCGIEYPVNDLPWMQNLIDSIDNGLGYFKLDCECNSSVIQYCFKNEVYFDTTPLRSSCSDFPSYIYDVNGNLICTKGGFDGGNCYSVLPDEYWNSAELINVVWSCNKNCGCSEKILAPVCGLDGNLYKNKCFANCASTVVEKVGACDDSLCTNFAFTNTAIRCEPGCGDYLEFELVGGDGNYLVNNGGLIVSSGDPVVYIFPGNNSANLTAIDGNGCLTEVAIPETPCGSNPPRINDYTDATCIDNELFTVGVQISGEMANYQINSIGEEVFAATGDLVYITLSSNNYMIRVELVNLDNGCTTNANLPMLIPDCKSTEFPKTGVFNCEE